MTESDTAADAASDIPPAHLAEVTRAVLPYLGTFSITAVKRASKGCSSLESLCDMVASQITEADKRERFMESARALMLRLNNPGAGDPSQGRAAQKSASGRPSTPITPELMQRGERALAHIIGPLAAVLVARYAKTAENSRQFFELLASHIRNPEERQAFFEVIRSQ
ncbi:MAG: hypothetical protein JNM76_02235 [Betaproteobacteria bacterium]|nr:hypothetical protein [Betaproteobacteria bacterium]